MLHAQIYDMLLSSYHAHIQQQVLVLVTGDGNTNNGQTSFPMVVERVLRAGWSVEIWSWERSLGRRFFEIQKIFPDRMTINYLDPYGANITFEEKLKQTEDGK